MKKKFTLTILTVLTVALFVGSATAQTLKNVSLKAVPIVESTDFSDEQNLPDKGATASCDAPTNLSVTFDATCSSATLTWSAPMNTVTLWDNSTGLAGDYANSGFNSAQYFDDEMIQADDFEFTETLTITTVRYKAFVNGTDNNPAERPAYVAIKFYDDNGGAPGNLIREHQLPGGPGSVGNNVRKVLPEPLELGPGRYWLSVYGIYEDVVADYRIFNQYIGNIENGNYPTHFTGFTLGVEEGEWGPAVDFFTNLADLVTSMFTLEGGVIETFSYNIYRNNEKIAGPVSDLSFVDNTIDYPVTYSYSVTTICNDGTESTKRTISNVGCGLGINNDEISSFTIAPNPATTTVKLSANNPFNTIEVVNFIGQTIMTQTNNTNETTLDVSNLSNGVYFIRIISDNGTSVKKFVKQ